MTIVMLAMLFIGSLPLDLLIFILELSSKSILIKQQSSLNPRQIRCMNSIAKLNVATQALSFKVGDSQFDLYMRVDTNTNGHRQWFYFSVKNMLPGLVKFNIYRFKKKFSLFQRGLKPYVRSIKSNNGWIAGCGKIGYRVEKYLTNEKKNQNQKQVFYLTFEYKFEHPEDQVFFASGLPYSVSFLNKRLIQLDVLNNKQVSYETLTIGRSLCGQDLKLIQISPKVKRQNLNFIIINARTHAGQTSSSWVLDGLLEKLLKDPYIKSWITQNNICFRIIPMLNPDGVYIGNYRTGVLGQDFNRKFASGKRQLFPEIHCLKKIVGNSKKDGKVLMFLDLHGHSILKNSFIYGPPQYIFSQHPLRNLPISLWHNSKYFRLSSCKFKFEKDMIETARVYFQTKENILSFTCEISLGLYYQGTSTFQMFEQDYKSLGGSIITSISGLLGKQKVVQFQKAPQAKEKIMQEKQIQKISQTNSLVRQTSIRKQTEGNKREKQRETVIETIKTIKKELGEVQGQKQKKKVELNPKQNKLSEREGQMLRDRNLSKNKTFNIKKNDHSDNIDSGGSKSPNKISYLNKRKATLDTIDMQRIRQDQSEPIRVSRIEHIKVQRQAQFKIRRRSDLIKLLPESMRKKLGPKVQLSFTSTKHLIQMAEESEFYLERSATFDTPKLSQEISQFNQKFLEQDNLDIINEKFSQQYESINDEDNQSEDLMEKQKQYLIDVIKNNRKLKTNNEQISPNDDQQGLFDDDNPINPSTTVNINGFKEIRFKSIEGPLTKTNFPLRQTKRDIYKFRELTHKSLGKNLCLDEQMSIPQMVQKKQLNERINKKNVRQPYFLVQIKNKNQYL